MVARLANCMAVLRRVPGAYVSKQRTALTNSKKKKRIAHERYIKVGGGGGGESSKIEIIGNLKKNKYRKIVTSSKSLN